MDVALLFFISAAAKKVTGVSMYFEPSQYTKMEKKKILIYRRETPF